MKKFIVVMLSLVFAASTLTACFSSGSGANSPSDTSESSGVAEPEVTTAVTSPTSSLTLEFPESWAEFDLNEIASIQMGYTAKEQYFIVIEDYAEDFAPEFNLDQFAQLVVDNLTTTLAVSEAPVIADTQIAAGIAAKQLEVSGTVDGINITYLITCFYNEGTYYQALAWSLPSAYEEAKPVFDQIINSASF